MTGFLMRVSERIYNLVADEEGATMVEYAIMVGFIAAVCIGVVTLSGKTCSDLFNSVPDF